MRKEYYVKRRVPKPSKAGKTPRKRKPKYYYYACFLTNPPDGYEEVSTKCSVRSTAEAKALDWYRDWKTTGVKPWKVLPSVPVPTHIASIPLCDDYLVGFWADAGEYARFKRLKGSSLSASYLMNSRSWINRYTLADWGPFKGKKLDEITPRNVERWLLDLTERLAEEGISTRTVNQVHRATAKAFAEAARLDMIPRNPFSGSSKAKETTVERKLFSNLELALVLDPLNWGESIVPWRATMLAFVTGFRLGEILGLTPEYVEKDQIRIRLSWDSRFKTLKSPKTDRSSRDVPIAPQIATDIHAWARENPWNGRPGSVPFVFPSGSYIDNPISNTAIEKAFGLAMAKAGIPLIEQRSRGLTFHAIRHYVTSQLHSATLSEGKVLRLLGHAERDVHDRYTHGTESDVLKLQEYQMRIWTIYEQKEVALKVV